MWRILSRRASPIYGRNSVNAIRPFSSAPSPNDSFMSGTNSIYAEEMYRVWKTDPSKVHSSWDAYFKNLDGGFEPAYTPPPSIQSQFKSTPTAAAYGNGHVGDAVSTGSGNERLVLLIRAFQARGHEMADLDPLKLNPIEQVPELDPASYGFEDLNEEISLEGIPGIEGFLGQQMTIKLSDFMTALKRTYCGTIGVEYMHVAGREKCNFIRERFEIPDAASKMLSKEEKIQILERITFAEQFEKYLAGKWNTAKRFGIEGCEATIPGFKLMIDRSTELGVDSVVIGMPHRGRLNILSNVVRKPLETIFSEFAGNNIDADEVFANLSDKDGSHSGDVKYHLGTSFDRQYPDGRKVHLSLVANPSHLEAVNPVVLGKTRAKQYYSKDSDGSTCLPVLLHGDAAFCGQGIVYETIGLTNLKDYKVGGTVHIVVNNQIGFTTDPAQSRSTRYCTDLGKAFDAPIFHVNADDPEAVAYVFKMAAEYRAKFLGEVIIDIVGYRRYGHNELDQPMFTQPTMYRVIQKHPTVLSIHQQRVVEQGLVTQEHVDQVSASVRSTFDKAYETVKNNEKKNAEDWLDSRWTGFKSARQLSLIRPTGVDLNILKQLGTSCYTPPKDFEPHRNIKKILKEKRKMISTGQGLDWGCAEHLAYASLCNEKIHVRISGQDVQRGTFSHRHAVIHDQKDNTEWCGLNNIDQTGTAESFQACNSSLSEYGVLGFELGYSLENPNALVCWEAQFGDFVNGAQIIIDQFISCGEAKWLRQSGLVMLLPHGYDGMGPEHSSCRVERFLQLSDEDPDIVPVMDESERLQIQQCNWQVVNCTTPSQIFHVLRRQVHRDFRKPLIVISPKSLLKHKDCVSDIDAFGPGTKFQRLIPEQDEKILAKDPKDIRKLVFCTGKVYYDLVKGRSDKNIDDIAIVRIEQITPFPFDKVAQQVKKYPNAEMIYTQEEPKNMGAWYFIDDRIYTATRVLNGDARRCEYVGRRTMASPAVGYGSVHSREQTHVIDKTLA